MVAQIKAVATLMLGVCGSAALLGQQTPATSSPSAVQEFPVMLQQSVTAGKTPAGTRIQATLEAATLVDGTVIPRNAVFSGEVIESVAKTKSDQSRLGLRMDLAQWKNGSARVKVYLTAWYYPTKETTGQDLQYGPQQSAKRTWNGQGQYPDPNSKSYKPFPGSDSDKSPSVPDTPSAAASNHRVLMKDVVAKSGSDGSLALVSKQSNIKLDKLTTYVLASSDLVPAK
jgi:hypothetical protein